jgi:hypothetical protein
MNNKLRQISVVKTYQLNGSSVIYLNSVKRKGKTTNLCRSYMAIVALQIGADWRLSHPDGCIPPWFMQREGPFLYL